MLEMAASGAKILHPRCVEYARRYNIPIHVRSSFSSKEGTWIVPDPQEGASQMEQALIAGIAHDRSEAKITVVGVPDKVGEAARIFEALAEVEINIDMVVQNISAAATGLTDISFTLPRDDGQTAMAALARLQGDVGYDRLMYDDEIGKVSLIGAGMRSHPGITAKFFAALAHAGVNIEMISTSEVRITCMIAEADLETALRALHDAFELERPESIDAIDAGACAYLAASATGDEVLEAVRRADRGEVLMPAAPFVRAIARRQKVEAEELHRDKLLRQFTPRELDVLRLLAQGYDTTAMATGLGIAPHTVEWHVGHLVEKFQVHSKLQALIAAVRLGVVEL
jgi:DNA-binding NarL/FixJ family response regulator